MVAEAYSHIHIFAGMEQYEIDHLKCWAGIDWSSKIRIVADALSRDSLDFSTYTLRAVSFQLRGHVRGFDFAFHLVTSWRWRFSEGFLRSKCAGETSREETCRRHRLTRQGAAGTASS
jgi:hypothetical protein